MSRVKTFSVKLAALVVALVVAVVAFSAYGSSQNTNAAYSVRYYWRHDYSSTNPASYTQYSLSVEQKPRSIIGTDDMVNDNETSVVSLTISGYEKEKPGTGFIVDDHVIATSAYCVYNKGTKKFNNIKIEVVGPRNETLLTVHPKYAHVSEDYVTELGDYQAYDYALLYVEEDLSSFGIFDLGIATDKYADDKGEVILSGFPDGHNTKTKLRRKMSIGNATSSGTNAYHMAYDADTKEGNRGCPVYVEEGFSVESNGEALYYGYTTVIAINGESDTENSSGYNSGVRLDANHLKFYLANSYLTA